MLLFFPLLSSPYALVNYLVAFKFRRPPMLLTQEFRCLVGLFADAMNIPCKLQILKVV
jgi:hypothetical protein